MMRAHGTQLIKNVDYTETFNGTYYLFTITYQHSTHRIEILATNVIPEFTSYTQMLMDIIAIIVFGFIYKKRARSNFLRNDAIECFLLTTMLYLSIV